MPAGARDSRTVGRTCAMIRGGTVLDLSDWGNLKYGMLEGMLVVSEPLEV